MKIIYDIGCNSGKNINYYLKKSDVVVAVDANPMLIGEIKEKFKKNIENGNLIVENFVIYNEDADVDFFVHKSNDVLSTVLQQESDEYERIKVPSKKLSELVKKYGNPYYLKIDIEGYDYDCLKDIFQEKIFPDYISVEMNEKKLEQLVQLIVDQNQYEKFNIVHECSVCDVYKNVSIKTKELKKELFCFEFHSAGPFGEDIKTEWFDKKDLWWSIEKQGIGWKDLHAIKNGIYSHDKFLNLLVVSVCVNYSDYLSLTWEKNKDILSQFDYWIITDHKDKQTEKFCLENKINLFKTDTFYQNGSSFNKGAALNDFFLSQDCRNLDWILLIDSDIILNDSINDFVSIIKEEKPGFKEKLYSCSRKVYKTKEDYLNGNFWWEVCHFIGYFQLFNKDAIIEKLQKKEKVFLEFSNSAVYDVEFSKLFDSKKVGLASDVCHLGMPCQNWNGRVADNFFEQSNENVNEIPNMSLKLIEDEKILFKQEHELKRHINFLLKNIKKWTRINCPIYKNKDIVCKEDLQDRGKWYVKINNSRHAHTNGTSSGIPFEYMRWDAIFHKIEWDNHYDMVLDEFDVSDRPHILYFLPHSYEKEDGKFIACSGRKSELNFVNHGSKRNPIIHHVNFELYRQRQEEFYEFLLDYVKERQIDVFYTSPPQVNSLCSYIRKFGRTDRLGYLLSVTGDRFLPEDASFLLDGGYFDHICDHMRCWDGGATFFTCKYRNYHLMDNLAWCEEGPNHELICTDYFNLASPFVRYWNGDYCRIAKEYQRCECGRLYRDFEFLESRPFSLKGTNMKEIQEKIRSLGIKGIKQVRCSIQDLSVVSTRNLTDEEKERIQSVSDKFQFKFFCELF